MTDDYCEQPLKEIAFYVKPGEQTAWLHAATASFTPYDGTLDRIADLLTQCGLSVKKTTRLVCDSMLPPGWPRTANPYAPLTDSIAVTGDLSRLARLGAYVHYQKSK